MSRSLRSVACLLLILGLALPAEPATLEVLSGSQSLAAVNLQTTQTGNADSTNTADRGSLRAACLLKITSTVGATPTVTVNVLGSMDNTNFYNVAYAVAATPETPVVTAITITSATTGYYILRASHPWRFLKVNMSANTNVTLTTDVWCAL